MSAKPGDHVTFRPKGARFYGFDGRAVHRLRSGRPLVFDGTGFPGGLPLHLGESTPLDELPFFSF